jgi:PHD/YefM family antitoxin component YafN of YafNO toxin-antitoxin module
MLNLPVEEAKERLAALIKQVASKGEMIVIQTADGLRAALVNLADLPLAELKRPVLNGEMELAALAAADAVRERILARRNGQPLIDSSRDLEAIRELRLLELQGVY